MASGMGKEAGVHVGGKGRQDLTLRAFSARHLRLAAGFDYVIFLIRGESAV
jgi:hypothetical protein